MPACSLWRTKLHVQHCCHNKHFCNICKRFTMPHCSSFVVCKKKVAKYIKRVPLLLLFDLSQKLLTTKKTMTTSSTVADSWKTPLAIHFSQFVPTVLCAQRFLLNFASLFVLELCISFPLQKLSHVGFFQELVAMTTKTSSRTLSECRALLA